MGILETLTTRTSSNGAAPAGPLFQNRNGAPAAREERQDAKVWINIGYYVTIGEDTKFVNLPLGMPLDTMKPARITGQNEDWIKLQTARNGLLNEMQKLGAELAPGQTVDMNQTGGLVIQLRRVAEAVEVASTDNAYSVDLTTLMFGGAANVLPAE